MSSAVEGHDLARRVNSLWTRLLCIRRRCGNATRRVRHPRAPTDASPQGDRCFLVSHDNRRQACRSHELIVGALSGRRSCRSRIHELSNCIKRAKFSGNSTRLDGSSATADSSTLSGKDGPVSQVIVMFAAERRWKSCPRRPPDRSRSGNYAAAPGAAAHVHPIHLLLRNARKPLDAINSQGTRTA